MNRRDGLRRPWRLVRFMAAGLLLGALLAAGCSREHYRRRADNEVYGLIAANADDPRWQLTDYSIEANPASRFYDPNRPNHPPMPPDDPASHQYMHRVDCKCGACGWHANGDTPCIENPAWRSCLPWSQDCALVLDRQLAMRVALINSREYQQELEDLYLSALDVTFQRFRFDVQFFASNSTFYTNDGPRRAGGPSRELRSDTTSSAQKLGAAGGQLVVELANSLVWQFAGPDDRQARSILDFSLVQPLLRGAGKAVVLEGLTDSERALLANVRQMEHYRHGFYTQIVAGRAFGPGPLRGGLIAGALTPSFPGATGGIYALLSDQVRIRNQRTNVGGLRDSLEQIEAHYGVGRIDRLQVDVARQALYNAQSRLLSLETAYDDRLDAYKITLGVPPDLNVRIHDPLLKDFDLVDPRVTAARDRVADLLSALRSDKAGEPTDYRAAVAAVRQTCIEIQDIFRQDMEKLEAALPARRADLEQLVGREEVRSGDVDPGACSIATLENNLAAIRRDYPPLRDQLARLINELGTLDEKQLLWNQLENLRQRLQNGKPAPPREPGQPPAERNDPVRETLVPILTQAADVLLSVTLVEAAARLQSITLVPVELDPDAALQIARVNRLDWMNARAALVDSWRQIRVRANALQADLDVILSGDVSTVNNNPFRFRGDTGRLRVGFQFDPPLTRLVERNLYREALINYQQTRRAYMAYEDRVNQSLRATLRSLRQSQLDFELRRAGVVVAISQVIISRERLLQPPKPGTQTAAAATTGQTGMFGATTVRDLVQAYSGLLSAQDSFLTAWVEYEADRLNLDFDLGTMQLDAYGMWVDPGPIEPSRLRNEAPPGPADDAPIPPAMPLPEPPEMP